MDESIDANLRTTDKLEVVSAKLDPKLDETYELLGEIGTGGMGAVYKARHKVLGKLVAIKRIVDAKSVDETAIKRFINEAKAASMLKHENLVSIREFGVDQNDKPYAVMDFISGESLGDLIASNPSGIAHKKIIDIAIQVAEGLQHAHKHGIVHRDIKPSNIIVSADHSGADHVTIVDFGIAKINESTGQKLTQTGEIYGSPFYVSPEQAIGKVVDNRSDFYSLGCVIYECLCGSPPFVGENAIQTAMKHLNCDIPQTNSLCNSTYLPGLVKVVNRCLQKDPEARYQNAAELIDDLNAVAQGQVIHGTQGKKSKTKKTYTWLWIASSVLVIVLIAFWTQHFFHPVSKRTTYFSNLPISESAKVAYAEESARSFAAFNNKNYEQSAFLMQVSAGYLEKEIKKLNSVIAATTNEAEKNNLESAKNLVEWTMYEDYHNVAKCYLELHQYDEAMPFLGKSVEHFYWCVTNGWGDSPRIHDAFNDYIMALKATNQKAKSEEIQAKYERIKDILAARTKQK